MMVWQKFLCLQILPQKKSQKKQPEVPDTEPVGDLFLKQKPFPSLLSTVTLFLEQESVSRLAMNLDVNYCQVNQENFNKKTETENTMQEMIFMQDGDSFQNSPIDLIFYEKKILLDNSKSSNYLADVASMSYCKLSSERFKHFLNVDIAESAYNLELLLCMKNMTAQFVTKKEYQQILFILGFKDYNSKIVIQDYKKILALLNDFDTATEINFKDMIKQLQFPYIYDDQLDLAENRQQFKDFFSCLTKIRCAVVEGSH